MLNQRLQAVKELVPANTKKLLDIGTEHALLPIALIKEGKVDYAVASDMAKKPLKQAKINVENEGLGHKIALRLGNGLEVINANESLPDVIVIAGIGGKSIIHILNHKKQLWGAQSKLVLQPMTASYELRHFLLKQSYDFIDETLIKDNGYFYQAILAGPEGSVCSAYDTLELEFGPRILARGGKTIQEYLNKEIARVNAILEQLRQVNSYKSIKRYRQLVQRYYALMEVQQRVVDR